MARLLIVFAGTGNHAANFMPLFSDTLQVGKITSVDENTGEQEEIHDDEDVVQVYISGCQARVVGGRTLHGRVDPNLDTVATNLASCFTDQTLHIDALQRVFGQHVIVQHHGDTTNYNIESITLSGFSRGAVATFASARALDKLNIPMHILALDPVPGDSAPHANTHVTSEYHKNFDLSHCKNLTRAEVLMGACARDVGALHNTYFKEMGIKTADTCATTLAVIPRKEHNDFSNIDFMSNHASVFLSHEDIKLAPYLHFNTSNSQLFMTPKIRRQNFHQGVLGRTQLSAFVRQELQYRLKDQLNIEWTDDDSYKKGLALYALSYTFKTDSTEEEPSFGIRSQTSLEDLPLYQTVINDDTAKGAATREFIVELESILQARVDEPRTSSLALLRFNIYQYLANYQRKSAPTHTDNNKLTRKIMDEVALIDLPRPQKQSLTQDIALFLERNCIFHPQLTTYLQEEEEENFYIHFDKAQEAALDQRNVADETDIDMLIYRLYELSYHASHKQIRVHKALMPKLATMVRDASDLANILRFFEPSIIKKTLPSPALLNHIHNLSELNQCLNALFTEPQRKILYHAYMKQYPLWLQQATPEDITEFKSFFSLKKQQHIDKLLAKHVALATPIRTESPSHDITHFPKTSSGSYSFGRTTSSQASHDKKLPPLPKSSSWHRSPSYPLENQGFFSGQSSNRRINSPTADITSTQRMQSPSTIASSRNFKNMNSSFRAHDDSDEATSKKVTTSRPKSPW